MQKLLLILVALLIMAGCSPFIESSETTEPLRTMPTPIALDSPEEPTVTFTVKVPDGPKPQQTATILTTETFVPTLPEIIRFRPEQIHQQSLCPTDDFIPIQDLGIPPDLSFLLTDKNVSDFEAKEPYPVFLYKPGTPLPGKHLPLNKAEKMQGVPVSSPDGKYFFYLQYNKGQPARTFVLQSTDDQKEIMVLERAYPYGWPSWIDNHHLVWIDIPDPENYWSFGGRPDDWDYIPTHIIDVQTLEVQELPPIQFRNKNGYYTLKDFTNSDTGYYAFLQHANTDQVSYEIYSYATQTSQPLFTWLPVKFLRDPRDTRSNISNNGRIYFIALEGNVFWIVSQVSIEQALSGPEALAGHMYEFTFPEAITPSFILYYFKTQNAFLYTGQEKFSEAIHEAVPQYLYRLDIDSQTVYDYCFDIQKRRGFMSLSPDEEFAAVTLYQDPMTGNGKKDTILINLSNGDRAVLPGYEVLDWVRFRNQE